MDKKEQAGFYAKSVRDALEIYESWEKKGMTVERMQHVQIALGELILGKQKANAASEMMKGFSDMIQRKIKKAEESDKSKQDTKRMIRKQKLN